MRASSMTRACFCCVFACLGSSSKGAGLALNTNAAAECLALEGHVFTLPSRTVVIQKRTIVADLSISRRFIEKRPTHACIRWLGKREATSCAPLCVFACLGSSPKGAGLVLNANARMHKMTR